MNKKKFTVGDKVWIETKDFGRIEGTVIRYAPEGEWICKYYNPILKAARPDYFSQSVIKLR